MSVNRILSVFSAPHPAHFDARSVVRNALLSGLVVSIILAAFQPFELSTIPEGVLLISLGFGGVTFAMVMLIGFVLPKILTGVFDEDNWTVWRNVLHTLFVVMCIGFGNLLYIRLLGYYTGDFWRALGLMELYTFGIAVFPVGILTLLEQNRELKKHAARAEAANASGKPGQDTSATADLLVFRNEQGRPELQLQVSNWRYIRADKNYLDIYFDGGDDKLEKHVLRNRLSKVCDELNHPDVFHCHRSYAVNMLRVQRIEGNARGYLLHLDADSVVIPVSRSKTEALFERLETSR